MNLYRIVQFSLLLSVLVTIIFVAIVDEKHIQAMFYCSIAMIFVIGLWLARATDEFVEYKNEQIRKEYQNELNWEQEQQLYKILNNRKEKNKW